MSPLTHDQTSELAEIFRLLGDPTRLAIVLAVAAEPRSVGAVAEALGLSPSLVSHHLRLLRAGRLVRAERQGKQVFYVLADDHVRSVVTDMAAHVREPHPED
jgi:DNA-binding transcriptional ArsR family regulator